MESRDHRIVSYTRLVIRKPSGGRSAHEAGGIEVVHLCLRILAVAAMMALGFSPCALAGSDTDVLAACAAFAQDGGFATATVGGSSLSLEITRHTGEIYRLSLRLRYPMPTSGLENTQVRRRLTGCEVYFSQFGDLVALEVSSRLGKPEAEHLQIGVANMATGKWISDFGIEPRSGFVPSSLAGFLEDTTSLVVVGTLLSEENGTGQGRRVTIQLFSPTGEPLNPVPVPRGQNETTDAFRYYADTLHNRVWSFSCSLTRVKPYHVPLCPVTLTSLVGEKQDTSTLDFSNYRGKRDDLWEWPGTFAAPDANAIIIAETVGGKDTIWRVEMPSQNIDRFVLPNHHFLKYNGMQAASLSPDARVYAVLRQQREIGFPYFVDNYVFRGTDVVVMQTHPLQLLGTIAHKDSSFTPAVAVDHRDGKAIVLVYRQDHWERHVFAAAQP